MTNNSGLPFDLTERSRAEWLKMLGALPASRAASQLNQMLKQLKGTKLESAELMPLLIEVVPLTLHLSRNLAAAALAEQTSSAKTLKVGKLCMQLPRQLALIFCQLLESQELDSTSTAHAIYLALQLIGHCARYYSLFRDAPSATLWKKSAQLYDMAVEGDLLATDQSQKLGEFKHQANIEAVIKRNLLFSILLPNLYGKDEINHLFQFANQHGPLLEIGGQLTSQCDFYWDLNGDAPPSPARNVKQPIPEGYLAMTSNRLGQALQVGEISSDLAPVVQNKLALHLSGYEQIFSSIVPGPPSLTRLVLGFGGICAYLGEQNKLAKIMQLGAQANDAKTLKRNMTLVPLEHERNVFDNVDQPFTRPQSSGRAVNILKTPNKAYWIAEGKAFDCATGELVLLCKEQQPPALAIIRRQRIHDITGAMHILLELLPGICHIYAYSGDSGQQQRLVMLGEEDGRPEVFLAGGKYALGGKLTLSIDKSIRMEACLEANPFYARYRISFD